MTELTSMINQPVQQILPRARHLSLSLALSPEITSIHKELAKMAFLTVSSGFITDSSLEEVFPSVIPFPLAGPLTLVTEDTYLVPLENKEEVKEVCKQGTLKITSKEGTCSLKLTHGRCS